MHRFLLALVALATITATPAAAGSCCDCAVGCPPIVVQEWGYEKPYFIVNQGPVYSGPGIFIGPWIKPFHKPLAHYPYVSHDFPYYDAYARRPR